MNRFTPNVIPFYQLLLGFSVVHFFHTHNYKACLKNFTQLACFNNIHRYLKLGAHRAGWSVPVRRKIKVSANKRGGLALRAATALLAFFYYVPRSPIKTINVNVCNSLNVRNSIICWKLFISRAFSTHDVRIMFVAVLLVY